MRPFITDDVIDSFLGPSVPFDSRDLDRESTTDLFGQPHAAIPAATLVLGHSEAMRNIAVRIQMIADKQTTVLITGETGTGKERVARAIHALGARSSNDMVSVNCAGIPASLLEDEFLAMSRALSPEHTRVV